MCSFFLANWVAAVNLTIWNSFMQLRGPDATTRKSFGQWDLVHNLLSITGFPGGGPALQPYLPESQCRSESTGTAAIYNGEIYNHQSLRPFRGMGPQVGQSDGEVILPAYEDFGESFPRHFDGEFALAVVDTLRHLAILAVDVFGTKPLWYAISDDGQRFAAASYRSALKALKSFELIRPVPPNTVMVFDVQPGRPVKLLRQFTVFEFELRQWKSDTSDWEQAFLQGVRQRVDQNRHQSWFGLSSGHDSGAIHCALEQLAAQDAETARNSSPTLGKSKSYNAWTLRAGEWLDLYADRLRYSLSEEDASTRGVSYFIQLGLKEFEEHQLYIGQLGEPTRPHKVASDPAAVGLSFMGRLARQLGQLVYISGTGADEVLSDYGFLGVDVRVVETKFTFRKRRPAKAFPEDLARIFPWNNFFKGSMRSFLMKEEVVLGVHGLEARYPFLSPRTVQEFLWLTAEVKNSAYKAPVEAFLRNRGYPFKESSKLGFGVSQNLKSSGSLVNMLPAGRPVDETFWDGVLETSSVNCLGKHYAPGIRDELEELASQLRDPCKLFSEAEENTERNWGVLRGVLSWANIVHQFDPVSSECTVNSAALRFATYALLSKSSARLMSDQEKGTDPGKELTWLFDLDWDTAANSRFLRVAFLMIARAAERAEILEGMSQERDNADCIFAMSATPNEIKYHIRDRWDHALRQFTSAGSEADQVVSKSPLVIRFLASTVSFWLAVAPDNRVKEGLTMGLCQRGRNETLCWPPLSMQPHVMEPWQRDLGINRQFQNLAFHAGLYEVSDLPVDDCVVVAFVKARGKERMEVKLDNGQSLILQDSGGEWLESHVVLSSSASAKFNWHSAEEVSFEFLMLPCHGFSNTKFTEALHADGKSLSTPYFDVPTKEDCCALCYAHSSCETWMWLSLDRPGCWILNQVQGFEYSDFGPLMGRIRGTLN